MERHALVRPFLARGQRQLQRVQRVEQAPLGGFDAGPGDAVVGVGRSGATSVRRQELQNCCWLLGRHQPVAGVVVAARSCTGGSGAVPGWGRTPRRPSPATSRSGAAASRSSRARRSSPPSCRNSCSGCSRRTALAGSCRRRRVSRGQHSRLCARARSRPTSRAGWGESLTSASRYRVRAQRKRRRTRRRPAAQTNHNSAYRGRFSGGNSPRRARAAAVNPLEQRRCHERGDDGHEHQHREQRRADDAGLQPDVEDDELGETARIHERADAERAAIVLAREPRRGPARDELGEDRGREDRRARSAAAAACSPS